MSHAPPENAHRWDIRPYGRDGFLVSPMGGDALDALTAMDNEMENNAPTALSEWVIGYDSALLLFRQPTTKHSVANLLDELPKVDDTQKKSGNIHHIEVRYDGPDLAEVATAIGVDIDEVVRRHCTPVYRVRFLGFAPGFAYLDGLDPSLHLPRRATPRPRMNAGAVAIGGAHAGVYAVPTPGGWNWLGNTEHPLFQPDTSKPFTLAPGDSVQFIAKT